MKRIEYHFTDKSTWPSDGPWNSEPDKIQWLDEASGLPCLIVRGPSGALCGYVGVPSNHPLHGKDYDQAHSAADIEVHGGLTFAGSCHHTPDNTSICHIPEEGEPDDVWWLGFDCAHSGDVSPAYDRFARIHDSYKNIRYVTNEVQSLARQLKQEQTQPAPASTK